MKKKLVTVLCTATLVGVCNVSVAEVTGNIGVTSNYVWRGMTQTVDGAAIQGGLDYAHDSGFYLGTWASNVDFGASPGYELDIYGGYSGSAGEIGYDIGLIGYLYPDPDNDGSDFYEAYGSVSYGMFSAGLNYQLDAQFTDENYVYYFAGLSFDLANDFSLGATLGNYDLRKDGDDITHWQIDLTKGAGDFGDFTMSYSGADEDSGDDDPKVFVSWSKGF